MIPQDRQEAVTRGLQEAFGVTDFENIRALTNGNSSALIYRVEVKGAPYLLRIITRTPDPTLPDHIACMTRAADAGLAPRVRYVSVADRIVITDFVDGAIPFSQQEALQRMPAALRMLHSLPAFPTRPGYFNTTCTFLLSKGPALDGLLEKVHAAKIFPNAKDEQLLFALYERVAAVYPFGDGEMVSSHNDLLKPDNVLFDGRKVWLVDWEAAFLNDRYVDLAVVADFLVKNEVDESAYLRTYFGQAPSDYQRARFFLMRQLVHVFYSMSFLWLGSLGGHAVDWRVPVPAFDEVHRRIWEGGVNIGDRETKVIYGRAHWERLQAEAQSARWSEAVNIVEQGRS